MERKKFLKATACFTFVNLIGVISAVLVAQKDTGAAVLILLAFLIGGPAIVFDRFFTQ